MEDSEPLPLYHIPYYHSPVIRQWIMDRFGMSELAL